MTLGSVHGSHRVDTHGTGAGDTLWLHTDGHGTAWSFPNRLATLPTSGGTDFLHRALAQVGNNARGCRTGLWGGRSWWRRCHTHRWSGNRGEIRLCNEEWC